MSDLLTNVVLLIKCQSATQWQVLRSIFVQNQRCHLFEADENGSLDPRYITQLLSGNGGTRYVCHMLAWEEIDKLRKACLKRPACLVIEAVEERGPTKEYVAFQLIVDKYIQRRVDVMVEQAHLLVRPEWDTYFLHLALLVSTRANCRKRRVGAVVVKDRRIVTTGYNGTPTGTVNCLDGGCERCQDFNVREGEKLQSCVCLHAETNAIIEQGRDRVREGTLFVTCTPCIDCAKTIIQAGIKRVVYLEEYSNPETTLKLLESAGVVVERGFLQPKALEPFT